MNRAQEQRGGALVLVLWMSAALGAIALSVSTTVRTETGHTSAVSDGLRAHYLATGSLDRALQWMLWGSGPRNPDGTPKFWDRRLPRMNMTYAGGNVIVEMIPETAKLDVNTAPAEDLLRVVTAVTGDSGQANTIVRGILDWRGPGSAFDNYYLQLGPTFRPRHASLQEIEELLFVRGVTPELFYGNIAEDGSPRGGLRDSLSVWGSRSSFDANGASPALLQAIGMTPQQAAMVVQRRMQSPFLNLSEVQALGVPVARLRVGGISMWTMRATARLRRPDGGPSDTVRSVSMVVKYWDDTRLHAGPVQVVRYYGDAWSEFSAVPR